MRICVQITVYVVAFTIGHSVTEARDRADWVTDITPLSALSSTCTSTIRAASTTQVCEMDLIEFNGFDQYRQTPDSGPPFAGGYGFPHFHLPLHRYTNWYRPRAATLRKPQRGATDPWRPKGFGHLFARPAEGYRLEYAPYELCCDRSVYGPAYIVREPNPQCDEHCDHAGQ